MEEVAAGLRSKHIQNWVPSHLLKRNGCLLAGAKIQRMAEDQLFCRPRGGDMLCCFVLWIPVNTFPSQGLALRRWVWSFDVTPLVESESSPRAREFTCACILFATGRQVRRVRESIPIGQFAKQIYRQHTLQKFPFHFQVSPCYPKYYSSSHFLFHYPHIAPI